MFIIVNHKLMTLFINKREHVNTMLNVYCIYIFISVNAARQVMPSTSRELSEGRAQRVAVWGDMHRSKKTWRLIEDD